MSLGPVEVARGLFGERFADWPGRTFDLLTEDTVVATSGGQLYVGHEGFAAWYEEQISHHEDRGFVEHGFEALDDEWVLARGQTTGRRRDGEEQIQPGCWLVRVRDGRVAASLYYRTADTARAAWRAAQCD